MKTKSSSKWILILLLVFVCAYFGVQAQRYFATSQSTVMTYAYETEDRILLDGYMVRSETVIDCGETLLEISHGEGERVAVGSPLATVFHSQEALERTQELNVLRARLEQSETALSAASDASAALKLDGEISGQILSLRANAASGSYSAVNDMASELKTTLLRRQFAYHGTGALTERIASLRTQVRTVSAAVSGASQKIAAPFAGTYSSVVDGYETVLTPDKLSSLTPSSLASLTPTDAASTVGKLIAGNRWYFVAAVSEAEASRLRAGQSAYLRMLSGVDFDLPVTVKSIGSSENGKVLLTLQGDRYLSSVTLLRDSRAELILHAYSGLRIPKKALRMDENGQTGVYCMVGLVAYFKPVETVYQGEDYLVVVPGEIDSTVRSTISLRTLRAGDEVIISSGELFDGKVIEG